MIYFLRCNNIRTDSRLLKYVGFCQKNNIDYKIYGWDRTNENIPFPQTKFFKHKSSYNLGGLKAIFHRVLWMSFIFKCLIKGKNEITVIHACDLDTAFPSALFKFFVKKNVILIFDCFDWFSSTQSVNSKAVKNIVAWMEKYSTQHSDHLIICEKERIAQIPFTIIPQLHILPNIPSFDNYSFLSQNADYQFDNNNVTLSYVGGFTKDRFLEELLCVAETGRFNLLIAGFGDRGIERKCNDLSRKCKNIKYFGKVDYQIGLSIMYNSDIVYAMYCKTTANNIYAAPNKYYEVMLLGKAIITTKGTILEKKVIDNEIGYVIDENIEELQSLVSAFDYIDVKKKGENARRLWELSYSEYTANFMSTEYKSLIC